MASNNVGRVTQILGAGNVGVLRRVGRARNQIGDGVRDRIRAPPGVEALAARHDEREKRERNRRDQRHFDGGDAAISRQEGAGAGGGKERVGHVQPFVQGSV